MERKFSIGEWVEVKSKEEILSTLDGKGRLEGMPFMPEMLRFCGKRFQVYKRAHKTCDYTTPHPFHSRWLSGTVHLQTRCDGGAHGGCQAGCLLYWKEAWLKPVGGNSANSDDPLVRDNSDRSTGAGYQEADLWNHTQVSDSNGKGPKYICQMTEVPNATTPLNWWDVRQYIEDYRSGNVSLGRLFKSLIYSMYYNLSQAGIGVGTPMRWLYNRLRFLWGGSKWPRTDGLIPEGTPTPTISLNLQAGELVRVKRHEEILKTVTTGNINRGMHWDAELVPYCGGTYRVAKRVSKIIHEQTGKMQEFKTPCVILDSVVCQARYSANRMMCPKSMYPYWREIWLERVEPAKEMPVPRAEAAGAAMGCTSSDKTPTCQER